jgi:lipoate-protein ligase A
VCFVAAQGADLRVGERKVCGSAQVQRAEVVLQHGSVLLQRLAFDELDLLVPAPDPDHNPTQERERLRARSVTLSELGVAAEPELVAGALVQGFESALDVTFASRVHG